MHAVYLPGYIYWRASCSLFAHEHIFVSLSDTNMATKQANHEFYLRNVIASQVSISLNIIFNPFNLYNELSFNCMPPLCSVQGSDTLRHHWHQILTSQQLDFSCSVNSGIRDSPVHINIEQIHNAGRQSTNHVTELIPFYLVAGHAFNWLLCAVRTRLWDWITWHRQPQRHPLYNDHADSLPSVLPTGEAMGVVVNNSKYFTLFLVKMTFSSM